MKYQCWQVTDKGIEIVSFDDADAFLLALESDEMFYLEKEDALFACISNLSFRVKCLESEES